jgi:hypothetical protein
MMNRSAYTREPSQTRQVVTAALGTILLSTLLIPAVPALHVDGVMILMDVQPGKTYLSPMGVSIDGKDPATDIAVDVMGFGQSGDGTYLGISPASDASPYSARSFVSVEAPAVHLDPGGSRSFNATIRVPEGVGSGGRYATIYIHPQASPAGGAGSGVVTAVLVPVMLTVAGTTLDETGTITDIRAGEPVEGQPVVILTTLKNTGNHHYYGAFVEVTVTDPTGKLVSAGSTKPSVWALIPGNGMTFRIPVTAVLTPGSYTVKAEARRAEGTVLLDTRTVALPIGIPQASVPAAAPAGTGPAKTVWPDATTTAAVISVVLLLAGWRHGK